MLIKIFNNKKLLFFKIYTKKSLSFMMFSNLECFFNYNHLNLNYLTFNLKLNHLPLLFGLQCGSFNHNYLLNLRIIITITIVAIAITIIKMIYFH